MQPKQPDGNKDKVELCSDAWERFERAVDAAVKSGPMHKVGKRKAKVNTKAIGLARKAEKDS